MRSEQPFVEAAFAPALDAARGLAAALRDMDHFSPPAGPLSPRSPYANELRWLWPSAEAARKWTQDKIDQKTTERGGYAIEDDDE